MNDVKQPTIADLEAGLEFVRNSPKDGGVLEMIVRRPTVNERETVSEATLDLVEGLLGDSWKQRGSSRTADGSANPEMQINIMNSRVAAFVAGDKTRWPLAGDQLFIDLDLSAENLPPGTRFSLGTAVIEVTSPPHTGCKKFLSRFGTAALNFVNSPTGRQLNLRGINAKIVQAGTIQIGDVAKKLITR